MKGEANTITLVNQGTAEKKSERCVLQAEKEDGARTQNKNGKREESVQTMNN